MILEVIAENFAKLFAQQHKSTIKLCYNEFYLRDRFISICYNRKN